MAGPDDRADSPAGGSGLADGGRPEKGATPAKRPSPGVQLVGSLLVAVAIAAVAIAVVTAKFGPTSSAERELEEQRIEQREEAIERRMEQREEAAEQRR